MTAIPALRPPRKSPATAYLRHMQQRKRGQRDSRVRGVPLASQEDLLPVTSSSSEEHALYTSSTSSNVVSPTMSVGGKKYQYTMSPTIPNNGGGCRRKLNPSSGTRSCVSTSSESEEPNSEESCSSHFLGGEDEIFPLPPIPDESSTAIVPMPIGSMSRSRSQATRANERYDEIVAVESHDGSIGVDTFMKHHLDDDDSVDALDQLLEETSKRWEESCQQTHREFCRIPNCGCKTQDIIERQAAEIEALRAQLSQHNLVLSSARDHGCHHYDEHHQGCDADDEEEPRETFPLEQIEVYHDSDDHLSVTSGLTHLYDMSRMGDDAASFLQIRASTPVNDSSLQRPDAESVTGIQAVQPVRARDYQVDMAAADGTPRTAVYSGPLYNGKPHGFGMIRFLETGDVYRGDIVQGEMHGQGTYTIASNTFKTSSRRQPKVLKGTFEHNVFITGSYDPETSYWNTLPR